MYIHIQRNPRTGKYKSSTYTLPHSDWNGRTTHLRTLRVGRKNYFSNSDGTADMSEIGFSVTKTPSVQIRENVH